ncbi:hypothetical protein V6Z11_D04G101600 [Gossypium hirsutum]
MAHSLVSRLKQFEAPSSSDLDGANRAPSSPPRRCRGRGREEAHAWMAWFPRSAAPTVPKTPRVSGNLNLGHLKLG